MVHGDLGPKIRRPESHPSIGRAVLRPNDSDWYVLLEHPDGTPVHSMVFTYDENGKAVAKISSPIRKP